MGYSCARELFEAAREANLDIERTSRMLDNMEAREGLHAHPIAISRRGSGHSDPMRATDARIDAEAAAHARLEADWHLIDLASALCYGKWYDGKGGVDALLDSMHADCLYWVYLSGEKMGTITQILQRTDKTIYYMNRVSFEMLDAYGIQRAIDGTGIAEE